MAKVSYANLKLKVDSSIKTFDFENQTIEVKQYLPVEDKYDLVMIALQKSREGNIYNAIKVDVYFHLNLVYLYTNLSFTDKQKENEFKIYDALVSSGLLDMIIENIPEDEYEELFGYLAELEDDAMMTNHSASALIQSFINDLPKNAQAAANIVDNFDQSKYQAVIDFAKAANGGRSIE